MGHNIMEQDEPMVYEQEEVVDAIVMRHGLTDKPQIWQLVSTTIWYIWKGRCLVVF